MEPKNEALISAAIAMMLILAFAGGVLTGAIAKWGATPHAAAAAQAPAPAPVKVVTVELISYSGNRTVNDQFLRNITIGTTWVGMSTDSEYVRENNVTLYGVRLHYQ